MKSGYYHCDRNCCFQSNHAEWTEVGAPFAIHAYLLRIKFTKNFAVDCMRINLDPQTLFSLEVGKLNTVQNTILFIEGEAIRGGIEDLSL